MVLVEKEKQIQELKKIGLVVANMSESQKLMHRKALTRTGRDDVFKSLYKQDIPIFPNLKATKQSDISEFENNVLMDLRKSNLNLEQTISIIKQKIFL